MTVKTKEEYIADFINQFLDKQITSKFIHQHHDDFPDIQEFISMNLKKEFNWMTGIGLYESAEHSFNEAKNNSNFSGKLGFKISGLDNWMKYVCIDDYGEVYGCEVPPTPEIDKYGKRIWSAGDNRWYVLIKSDEIDCYNLLEYGLYKVKHNYELARVKVSEEEKTITNISDELFEYIIKPNDYNLGFNIIRIHKPSVCLVYFSEYNTKDFFTAYSRIITIDKGSEYIFNDIKKFKLTILKFLYEYNIFGHDIYLYDIKTQRKDCGGGSIILRFFNADQSYRNWTIHNLGGI